MTGFIYTRFVYVINVSVVNVYTLILHNIHLSHCNVVLGIPDFKRSVVRKFPILDQITIKTPFQRLHIAKRKARCSHFFAIHRAFSWCARGDSNPRPTD